MDTQKLLYGTAIAAVGLYFAIGCTSTTTGNEGNLDFSYTADDDVTNFNKPIAVGAKLELKVLETGSRREVEVTEASTGDPDVLDINQFSSNRVIVAALGEGSTTIEVTATTPDGASVSDSVNMLGAVPDVLTLRHTCVNAGEEAAYLVNTDGVRIDFEMEKDNGQPVIGYGYFPIEVAGDAELELNRATTDQAFFHFDIGAIVGPVSINSTIDDTSLSFGVFEPAAIDGIESTATADFALNVGETEFIHFFPMIAGTRVCQSEATVEAETSTPDICTVTAAAPADPDSSEFLDTTGYVQIEGKALGNCEFTVTYPDGMEGAGASEPFTAEVSEVVSPDEA